MARGPARRTVLKAGVAALGGVTCGGGWRFELGEEDSFDDALDGIHRTGPEFGGGLSNHAPMAAEALVELGHSDQVVSFVNRYGQGAALQPIDEQFEADVAAIVATLDAGVPAEILAREWARLIPSSMTAVHGLLRTLHAWRSLGRADTPSRRRELAHGLAYWNIDDLEPLPGIPGKEREAGFDVVQALAEVPLVPADRRINSGLINPRLRTVATIPEFVSLVEKVDLEALHISETITELTSAAARWFVQDGGSSIVILHAITGASVLRLASSALDEPSQRLGLGYAFQGLCAVQATQGTVEGAPAPVAESSATVESLVELARTTSDEHSIKLIDACLREYQVAPRPEYLAAALAWAT